MARYQLTLTYDGTDFSGSQRQSSARTVQGELERALRRLNWPGGSILMAGRTDTGVHALGQVASMDFEWVHTADELLRALNAELPPDLAVRRIYHAAPDFHPRFDAGARRYLYRLFCQPVREPLRERYAWRVWPQVETAALAKAALLFTGRHDFSSFGSATSSEGSTLRTVTRSEWIRREGEWQYEVEANAFLYRMVRRMVFVQVAVAQGKCALDNVQRALASATDTFSQAGRGIAAGLAPAHGLMLVGVSYESISTESERSVESVQDVLSESR